MWAWMRRTLCRMAARSTCTQAGRPSPCHAYVSTSGISCQMHVCLPCACPAGGARASRWRKAPPLPSLRHVGHGANVGWWEAEAFCSTLAGRQPAIAKTPRRRSTERPARKSRNRVDGEFHSAAGGAAAGGLHGNPPVGILHRDDARLGVEARCPVQPGDGEGDQLLGRALPRGRHDPGSVVCRVWVTELLIVAVTRLWKALIRWRRRSSPGST